MQWAQHSHRFIAWFDGKKDKLIDSPALMSDSDDDVHSRPSTLMFQTSKLDNMSKSCPE